MKEKIRIKDGSGDRDFFTIVPNYILNHSSGIDQALYLQMKRYAGEDGKCFATQETLCKKLGIGTKAYNKSLKYLIDKKWIEFIGLTGGKTRPIKTYKINNIWQENSDYYKKILVESTVSKDTCRKEKDTTLSASKILVESTVEEEPILRRTNNNNIATPSVADTKEVFYKKDINELIEIFNGNNLNYKNLFKNKTERKSCLELINEVGVEKAKAGAEYAVQVSGKMYAPTITTPYELLKNFGKLRAYYLKEKQKVNKSKINISFV